jgi:DNA modification methylase
MQVVMFPVGRLVAYARNPRTHSDEQIAQIAASIIEFGFTNPILIGPDDVIVAGHGRLEAAKRLDMAEVPVIVLGHLSDAQRRALVIADNRIAENAGWDEALLRSELAALQGLSFDVDLLGFTEAELADLLAEAGPIDGPEAAQFGDDGFVPDAPATPVSKAGDIWRLGPHRVMCGDSTSQVDVAALCGGGLVDACWTDPPYNVAYEGKAGKIANDDMAPGEFRTFLRGAFGCAFGVMKPGAPIYVAHADTEGLNFRAAFRDAGFKLSGCLIWVKPSLVLGRSDYQWRHEPILYGWKPGAAHAWFGGRAKTTVFEGSTLPLRVQRDGTLHFDVAGKIFVVSGQNMAVESFESSVIRVDKPHRNAEHPTMKPVELVERMLENSTQRGGIVLDLFGGSGSTLIACQKLGRAARLMELDSKFCDVIVRRWETFAGAQAKLEPEGQSFTDVEQLRKGAA